MINYVTKKPTFVESKELTLSTGSEDMIGGSLDFTGFMAAADVRLAQAKADAEAQQAGVNAAIDAVARRSPSKKAGLRSVSPRTT